MDDLAKYRKAFVIQALRRASYRWPSRYKTQAAARIERGKYKCNICGNIFPKKEMEMDHVLPVVPVEGFKQPREDGWDWNEYVERMLPGDEGWSYICIPCHDKKSESENVVRRARRAKSNKKKTRKKVKKDDSGI